MLRNKLTNINGQPGIDNFGYFTHNSGGSIIDYTLTNDNLFVCDLIHIPLLLEIQYLDL